MRALLLLVPAVALGCTDAARPLVGTSVAGGTSAAPTAIRALTDAASTVRSDIEGDRCRARAGELERAPALPGAPAFEANRIEILGRARGEPLVLAREPEATPDDRLAPALVASKRAFEGGKPGARVRALRQRHQRDPRALRDLMLRQGYAYMSDPHDALAMITQVSLPDLFDEPEAWLMRGVETRKLRRDTTRRNEVTYRYVDGPSAGRAADLLFGDRVALRAEDLGSPLHRDMRSFADEVGFDRARIARITEAGLLADLRFGSRWVRAVVESEGAALRLGCIAESKEVRDEVAALREASAPKRQVLARIHEVVTDQVAAGLRFDRPEGEETADRDGQLRPEWATAYFQGRSSFSFEEASFPVFDTGGNPWPPQVCVDFVLDTFERSSGTWYAPRGAKPERMRGGLDFNDIGITNRRAVLAFGKFAETRPDLFDVRRFQGEERIPFGERSRFFAYLVDHADEVRMGDVVAIHGLKRDDRIHQHAIFVEWTDPLTGFAYGLADQMKRPRRRTWEGIMAEAPKRSLFYRVRPREELIGKVARL